MVIREQRYTLEAFHAFSQRPENRDRLFELIDGEVVEKVASFIPSRIAGWISTYINMYLLKHPIGYVTGADGSYVLSPDHEFMPDVGYISRQRLPEIPMREVRGAPDLAVEVLSPTDSKRELRRKAEDYLRFGTRLVWLIFPETQRVEVYTPDDDVVELDLNGVLDGGEILPGFILPVRDIFPT
ncbi:MAG: Uma2 family endonuclease [Anaerolineae bacterium]|nr:Uma2 family endonuclease [Anaerolineae bacterium]NUQ05332.1 Uma2 family endonuclease [Anaerolineae bacterium]